MRLQLTSHVSTAKHVGHSIWSQDRAISALAQGLNRIRISSYSEARSQIVIQLVQPPFRSKGPEHLLTRAVCLFRSRQNSRLSGSSELSQEHLWRLNNQFGLYCIISSWQGIPHLRQQSSKRFCGSVKGVNVAFTTMKPFNPLLHHSSRRPALVQCIPRPR